MKSQGLRQIGEEIIRVKSTAPAMLEMLKSISCDYDGVKEGSGCKNVPFKLICLHEICKAETSQIFCL